MVDQFEGPIVRLGARIAVVVALMIIYLPPLYLLAISFNEGLQPAIPSLDQVSIKWYLALAEENKLLAALGESLLVATVTAVIATTIAFFSALAYMEMSEHRSGWFMFVIFSMFVPGVIQGLSLSVIFTKLGIPSFWATVVAGHLLWAMPFAFTVILTMLAVVKRSYLMAAADLGASWGRRLWDITLPLVRPGLIGGFIFSFLLSLNEYNRAFYLVGRQNTWPLDMFGKMNSGASPTIYALSGSILIASFLAVVLCLLLTWKRVVKTS
ncbi:ABC transporter permease [Sneathiella litorea]|uniref:ABC transporter permease subunit n=1 Tax=Sneathiella litorea TaxID=2606216 RepID=A0A6L8W437_9PROT|nr:ABC transporter permease subunit [Sneathiella litorea]MZR29841.1 ABC transporter permease subunit [Sneathiella litorea]